MNENGYGIFRAEAVRRHAEGRDRSVLPRFVSPYTFLTLWLALALVTAAGGFAWFAHVPIYATGVALAVERQGQPSRGEVIGVVFLPAQYHETLRSGQTVFVELPGAGTPIPRPVLAVEPEILSPAVARSRFALDPAAGGAITEPVVTVHIDMAPFPSGLPASAYVGSTFQSKVQVGSRPLLSLVPLIGPLLGG